MTTQNSLLRQAQRLYPAIIVATVLVLGIRLAHAGSAMPGMAGTDHAMVGIHHPVNAKKIAFGEPGKRSAVDRAVTITMLDASFAPNALKAKTGETIRFVVTNASEADHDFTIGDVATQTAHRTEMLEAMEKGANMQHGADPNAISVKAGQTGELIWKFSRAGRFEFDCNLPGHYEAGMKGVIVVGANGG